MRALTPRPTQIARALEEVLDHHGLTGRHHPDAIRTLVDGTHTLLTAHGKPASDYAWVLDYAEQMVLFVAKIPSLTRAFRYEDLTTIRRGA